MNTQCGVCGKQPTETTIFAPTVLECLHNICRKCHTKGTEFKCAICSKSSLAANMKLASHPTEICTVADAQRCTMHAGCKNGNRCWRVAKECEQCEKSMCLACAKSHIDVQDTHKIIDLESLTAKERGECMVQTNRCSAHVVDVEDSTITQYCVTCDTFICHHCILGDHKEHETQDYTKPMIDSIARLKKQIEQNMVTPDKVDQLLAQLKTEYDEKTKMNDEHVHAFGRAVEKVKNAITESTSANRLMIKNEYEERRAQLQSVKSGDAGWKQARYRADKLQNDQSVGLAVATNAPIVLRQCEAIFDGLPINLTSGMNGVLIDSGKAEKVLESIAEWRATIDTPVVLASTKANTAANSANGAAVAIESTKQATVPTCLVCKSNKTLPLVCSKCTVPVHLSCTVPRLHHKFAAEFTCRLCSTDPYGPKELEITEKASLDALTPEHLSLVRQVEKVLFAYVVNSKAAVPKKKYEEAYKMMLTLNDVTQYREMARKCSVALYGYLTERTARNEFKSEWERLTDLGSSPHNSKELRDYAGLAMKQ